MNKMKSVPSNLIHVVSNSRQHWVLSASRTICPECQAGGGNPCIDSREKNGHIMARLPITTVHAARVAAAGHNVRVY